MSKHNLKWKIYQQNIVSTENKQSFYLTRRPIITSSEKNFRLKELPKVSKFQRKDSTRACTISNYRSASTTPTQRRVQLSQNFDEQLIRRPESMDQQQSISVITTENCSNRHLPSNRVMSLYQNSPKPNLYQADSINENINGLKMEQPQQFGFLTKRSLRAINIDTQKLSNYNIMNEFPIIFKNNTRKNLFTHQSYNQYKKQTKNTNQKRLSGKFQNFVQKVLRNIKDQLKSKEEGVVRKYSQIWKENFQNGQFQELQKYSQSQQQFKLYFNQYIEKKLNRIRLENQINLINQMIKESNFTKQNQFDSITDLQKFYLLNHDISVKNEEQIADQQFRYKNIIKTYGMIDFVYETQDDIEDTSFFSESIQLFEQKYKIDFTPYLELSIINQKPYPLISQLDVKTKNILLSVEYNGLDQIIYQNNIDEIIPQFSEYSSNKVFRNFIIKKSSQQYLNILTGCFENQNHIDDIEYDNIFENQQIIPPKLIDKKGIMMKMRNQSKEAKIQGRRSTMWMINQYNNSMLNQITKNINVSSNQFLKLPQNLVKRQSKSCVTLEKLESFDSSISNQSEIAQQSITQWLNKYQSVKYHMQLKAENLLIFEKALKKEKSLHVIAQLMIEHNLYEEFLEFVRLNPNFSVDSKNIEGKPFIVLATQAANKKFVEYMINQNVQLNAKDLDGNTALHFAVAYQNYDIADLLLKNGASPYVRNRFNLNPWNWQQFQ